MVEEKGFHTGFNSIVGLACLSQQLVTAVPNPGSV